MSAMMKKRDAKESEKEMKLLEMYERKQALKKKGQLPNEMLYDELLAR